MCKWKPARPPLTKHETQVKVGYKLLQTIKYGVPGIRKGKRQDLTLAFIKSTGRIMNTKKPPKKENKIILDSLQQAVTETLEKKRKLGQYAVTWDNNKIIAQGDDAPKDV